MLSCSVLFCSGFESVQLSVTGTWWKKCKLRVGSEILKHRETILAPSIMMIDEACSDCGGSSFLSLVGVLLSDYTASHLERHRRSVSTEITRESVSKANKKTPRCLVTASW